MKITIVHLDLGIGGAERLIINIALCLKRMGHDVKILTSHHDKSHCFEETSEKGELGNNVEVIGKWIPHHLFNGKFTAFMAIIRMCYMVIYLLSRPHNYPDFVLMDGVSAPIPMLYYANIPVLFYCHFPDLLLCTNRENIFKRCYRYIIDMLEEYTSGCADILFVNSEFTASVVQEVFPRICSFSQPIVLYPTLELHASTDHKKSMNRVKVPPPSSTTTTTTTTTLNITTTSSGTLDTLQTNMISNTMNTNTINIHNNNSNNNTNTTINNDEEEEQEQSYEMGDGEIIEENTLIMKKEDSLKLQQLERELTEHITHELLQGNEIPLEIQGTLEEKTTLKKIMSQHHLLPVPQFTRVPYTKGYDFVFVSLNRYERKKNIQIAIQAYAQLKQLLVSTTTTTTTTTTTKSNNNNNNSTTRTVQNDSSSSNSNNNIDDKDTNTLNILPNKFIETYLSDMMSRINLQDLGKELLENTDDPYKSNRNSIRKSRQFSVNISKEIQHESTYYDHIDSTIVNTSSSEIKTKEAYSRINSVQSSPRNTSNSSLYRKDEDVKSCILQYYDRLTEKLYTTTTTTTTIITISDNDITTTTAINNDKDIYSVVSEHITQSRILLVIAGGYDEVVTENKEYLKELQQYADKLQLKHNRGHGSDMGNVDIVFRTSISTDERKELLQHATALLYTPDKEHFGIVPIETMFEETPVIAVNSGGPKETVISHSTGILCEQTAESFCNAMLTMLMPVTVTVTQPTPLSDVPFMSPFDKLKSPSITGIMSPFTPITRSRDSLATTAALTTTQQSQRSSSPPSWNSLSSSPVGTSSLELRYSSGITNPSLPQRSTSLSGVPGQLSSTNTEHLLQQTAEQLLAKKKSDVSRFIVPLGYLMGKKGKKHVMAKFTSSTMEQTLSRALRMHMYRTLPAESQKTRIQLTQDITEKQQLLGNYQRTKFYSRRIAYFLFTCTFVTISILTSVILYYTPILYWISLLTSWLYRYYTQKK